MKQYTNPTVELLQLDAEDILSTLTSQLSGGEKGTTFSYQDVFFKS